MQMKRKSLSTLVPTTTAISVLPRSLPLAARVPYTPVDVLGAFLANKRNPRTRAAYTGDLGHFARHLGASPEDGLRVVFGATITDVISWRDSQDRAGIAPATVQRRLSALRTFYRFAVVQGAIQRNPVDGVECAKVEAAKQRAPHLEEADVFRLLAAPDTSTVRGLRDRAILGLLACSGLRRAEVTGLRVKDVGHVPEGLTVTVDGKGGKVRTVDVDRATAAALLAYLDADGRAPAQAGGTTPLFRGIGSAATAGAAISAETIGLIVRRHAKRSGVRAVQGAVAPHALRRSFATVAFDHGERLEDVRRTMGHSDPRTTVRYDRRYRGIVTVTFSARSDVARSGRADRQEGGNP